MKARDIMTRSVISISEKATVLDAVRLMTKHGISGLPVVDAEGDLVGIISEGDLLRRTELATTKKRHPLMNFLLSPGRAAEEFAHTHGRFVGEVMTAHPRSITEDTDLEQIVSVLEKKRIRRVPVLREGNLVGIVTRSNVIKALAETAPTYSKALGDIDIRNAILMEMDRNIWAPAAAIDVDVADGIVTLSGTIFHDRERAALKVLAENVAGVRSVQDNLVWLDPRSGIMVEAEPKHPHS